MTSRSPAVLLPGADQENLGRVSLEHPVGGGLLQGIQDPDGDREPIPKGFLWSKDVQEHLAGRGLLQGRRAPNSDRELLLQGLCRIKGGAGYLAGGKLEGWRDSVATLARVARRHPQTAYAGLQKSLHQECAFVQRVTPDTGMDFQMVEDELRDIFLLDFFQGATAQILGR